MSTTTLRCTLSHPHSTTFGQLSRNSLRIRTQNFPTGRPLKKLSQTRKASSINTSGSPTLCSVKKLEETESVKVLADDGKLQDLPTQAGIYAVYDSSENLQYVGLSRRINASIEGHVNSLPELCHSVKVRKYVL